MPENDTKKLCRISNILFYDRKSTYCFNQLQRKTLPERLHRQPAQAGLRERPDCHRGQRLTG